MQEQWPDRFLQLIKDAGKNTDIRIWTGRITEVVPLRFTIDEEKDERSIPARFSVEVANGAAIGDRVLALQDVETQQFFVISRLM